MTIIGAGYVGLTAGCCFAQKHHRVLFYDTNAKKVALLERQQLPFYEPHLAPLLASGVVSGKITFTTNFKAAITHGDIIFIAVGTPQQEDGTVAMQALEEVIDRTIKMLKQKKLVVIKSTVPIGTTNRLSRRAQAHKADITIINNPEFLPEGQAVHGFLSPDRVVIGTEEATVQNQMLALYKDFVPENRILFMSALEAELTKYTANAMLATRISLMNEVAELADAIKVDFRKVQVGVGLDRRIGSRYLRSGVGYGGSCLKKDLNALCHYALEQGVKLAICHEVHNRNERQKQQLVQLALQYYHGVLSNKIFVVWGLSFKAHTDDMRDAPSTVLMDALLHHGAHIRVYDPKASLLARHEACGVVQYTNQQESLSGAHALFICTDWGEFKNYPYQHFQNMLTDQVIFDGRNIYPEQEVVQHKCRYFGIGFRYDP